ncbi:MAG: ATP-dependent protease ATPase subunit HslU [candidate division Zixibacteria bacterium]|nr:ATP-dependent protease ATPase subunit HslU [candidate division Zixibacteria bacterium]
MTPRQIVEELDKYVVGQDAAKKAVAIALRNRWRRRQLSPEIAEEIAPKNIIMIGPTGVGKTEIARRLARLANAPFVKVEASKFTEVGYVGRDVDGIVRDLADVAVAAVREELMAEVEERAAELSQERLLDILLPPPSAEKVEPTGRHRLAPRADGAPIPVGPSATLGQKKEAERRKYERAREVLRQKLRNGELDGRLVEIEVEAKISPTVEVFTGQGFEEMDMNLGEIFNQFLPKKTATRKVTAAEALGILTEEEAAKLVDMDKAVNSGLERMEQSGIVFVDELDKIVGPKTTAGPDVSREGVQRDLLPIVEGCSVNTKYGMVRTDHILFIAAGAFHVARPSDLVPELQGRFPIRVELKSLTAEDFYKILTQPKTALVKQYRALLSTEGVDLHFKDEAVRKIAEISQALNEKLENIGARRLHTVMETLLEELSFEAPDKKVARLTIDEKYVEEKLAALAGDEDLARYIL